MQRQLLDLLELASGRDFPTPQTLDLDLNKDLRAEAARLLPEGPEYIGLAPGSSGPPKCWPLENFMELARHLESQRRVPVFFLGRRKPGGLTKSVTLCRKRGSPYRRKVSSETTASRRF